jgi:hypothetical protein
MRLLLSYLFLTEDLWFILISILLLYSFVLRSLLNGCQFNMSTNVYLVFLPFSPLNVTLEGCKSSYFFNSKKNFKVF